MVKTVDNLKPGETGIVKKHRVKGALGKHLREIRIQGFSLALRKEEAESIELE